LKGALNFIFGMDYWAEIRIALKSIFNSE